MVSKLAHQHLRESDMKTLMNVLIATTKWSKCDAVHTNRVVNGQTLVVGTGFL